MEDIYIEQRHILNGILKYQIKIDCGKGEKMKTVTMSLEEYEKMLEKKIFIWRI